MHSQVIRSLFVIAAVVAGIAVGHAGPGTSTAEGKPCSKLLKGVVHLNDDDVRFARKGGGLVLVDPTSGPENPVAAKTGMTKPDLILITHPHEDHFQPAVLQAYQALNPAVVIAGPADVVKKATKAGIVGVQLVVPGQHYQLVGYEFDTVPAYFADEKSNHPKEAQWVGYVVAMNDHRYYVTGDTQPLAEMAAVRADVVFPLLSGCGGNMPQAVKMTKITGAKVVVPVHHANQVPTIKKFLAQLPGDEEFAYFVDGIPSTAL
jgi:L-ascorbate metabolism protein UlaG (beta-lactamase superfamily)